MPSTSSSAPKDDDDKDDKAALNDSPNDPAPSPAPALAPALDSTGKEAANLPSPPFHQDMLPKEEPPVREDVSSKQEALNPAPILPPSSNVMSSSVSNSLLNTPQKETRATQKVQQHDSGFAFSNHLVTIPSKGNATSASAGHASTLSSSPISPPSPAPASPSTLAESASAGTATPQEALAIPSEPALLGNFSGNTISESQSASEALANSQTVTNQISVNQAGPNQISTAQSAARQSATKQNETSQTTTEQVLADQSLVGEGPLILDSKPAAAQSPTKPESRLASAEEILDFLSEQLSARKTYPNAARQRHIEGKVRVGMSIAADGSLVSVRVIGKSGSTILDRAAVALVRELFPLSRQLEKALDVAVTIEYKLVK